MLARIAYVIPDYYSGYPKPCVGGWGRQQLTVTPRGDVLPCQAVGQIPGLPVENVRRCSLAWIWNDSPMFNRFRGMDWMPEPCRSCPRQHVDLVGCRCQAFQLTGDPAATDPVCQLSPHRDLVADAVRLANTRYDDFTDLVYG
jgi:pyrroloquinoline quinone biosynthesis protein E